MENVKNINETPLSALDKELNAMRNLDKLLSDFGIEERLRILNWALSKSPMDGGLLGSPLPHHMPRMR